MSGRIFQLSRSPGGVPKHALRHVHIGTLGLDGDGHKHPKIHGGPERAVCLYALELILALQAEGHPIFPGSTGENVTLAGVPWDTVVPGAKLALGEHVILEIASYTAPCNQIADSFTDRVHRRMDHTRNPGWSRVYARVLHGGVVRVGQPASVVTDT